MNKKLLKRTLFFAFALTLLGTNSFLNGKDAGVSQPQGARYSLESESSARENIEPSLDNNFPLFRYWKTPQESLDRAPWGTAKYYPIEIKEFTKWLSAVKEAERAKSETSQAALGATSTLSLDAKYDGLATLDGFGYFSTRSTGPNREDSDSELRPSRYYVPPFSFAVSNRTDGEDDSIDRLGVYSDGRFYYPNANDRDRKFYWTQRGKTEKENTTAFDLVFPFSTRTELFLETPSNCVVTTEPGLVQRVDAAESKSLGASSVYSERTTASEGKRGTVRWRVFFGGRRRARLTIVSRDENGASDEARKIGVREESGYRVTRQGIELSTRMEFERSAALPKELTFYLKEPLRLASLEWGAYKDSELNAASTAEAGQTRVVVHVPEDFANLEDLKLTAFCPVVLDDDFELPTVFIDEQDLSWKETTLRLAVARPLVVSVATPIDAAQAKEPARSRQDSVENLTFKASTLKGTVNLKLRSLQKEPAFDSATDCLLLNGDVSVKTTLFFRFTDSTSRVNLPLASNWKLDSVLSSFDAPISWVCEDEQGEIENSEDALDAKSSSRPRTLSISFKTPPVANTPVRVTISARRMVAFNDSILVDDLCPLDLSNNLYGAHALLIRAESPNQVRLTTRAGRPFSSSKTELNYVFSESQIREGLPASASGVRLNFGAETSDAVARLDAERLNYTTTGTCLCELSKGTDGGEKWRLHCEPTNGSHVERVIFFAPTMSKEVKGGDAPWKWSTSTDSERLYMAAELPAAEAAALKPPKGYSAYEIRLTASRSVPFDLNLERALSAGSNTDVPLIFLPESSSGSFEVILNSRFGVPFWTRTEAMDDSTAPLSPYDKYESLKKAFRYDPSVSGKLGTDPTDDSSDETGKKGTIPSLEVSFGEPFSRSESTGETLSSAAWCWVEKTDSFYEADGLVRNRALFLIENHGRSFLELTPPENASVKDVRCVWINDKKTSWLIDEDGSTIKAALPVNLRFVSVMVEYYTRGSRLTGFRKLTPNLLTGNLPVLSNVWEAWTPTQYRTYKSSILTEPDEPQSSLFSWWKSFFGRGTSERKLGKAAERMLDRLGDDAYREKLVAYARSARENGNGETPKESAALGPTRWVDVWGSQEVVQALFQLERFEPPQAVDETNAAEERNRSSNEGTSETNASNAGDQTQSSDRKADSKRAVQTSANAISYSQPFQLYVDRLATANVSLSTELSVSSDPSLRALERGAQLLEESGLVVLFLDETTALLSSYETLNFINRTPTRPLCGSSALCCRHSSDAFRLKKEITTFNNGRYVRSDRWEQSDELANPWSKIMQNEAVQGWTLTSVPLVREGGFVRIVNRNLLCALELACFVAFCLLTFYFNLSKPRFCYGVLGVCLALMFVVSLEWFAAVRGIFWGAAMMLAFSFLARWYLRGQGTFPSSEPKASQERKEREKAEPLSSVYVDESDATSTEGFVDFTKMPMEERIRLQGQDRATSGTRASADGPTGERENEEARSSAGRRDGFAAFAATWTLASALTIALTAFAPYAPTQDPVSAPTSRPSAQTPPQSGSNESSPASKTASNSTVGSASNASSGEKEEGAEWKEPYRVFVPVDENYEETGEYYWIASDFYETIRKQNNRRPLDRNWRVVDACYEGAVGYSAATDTTTLFSLKATYKIVLDGQKGVVSLPALPIAPDVGAKFDRQTIASTYDEDRDELLFEVESDSPGVHTLELTLTPPPFSETTSEISLPIVAVPSARLELSLPADAPALETPTALGKIVRSTGWLTAELGGTNLLVIRKRDASARDPKPLFDVEQLFLARPRTTQLDVRSIFRFQTTEKVKALDIDCDPLYAFSGYCQCEEGEIESVDPPTQQNAALHVVFKEAISGSFTLNVNFMARNFSGTGQLHFPQISARGARSLTSRFGVTSNPEVDYYCAQSTTVTNQVFSKAWGGSDDAVEYAYDLSIMPSNATFTTRPRPSVPHVDVATTFIFGASETEALLDATIDSATELYRITAETPKPFVVESASLTDSQGSPLDPPDYFITEDGVTFSFSTPIKGKVKLHVSGRTKTVVGKERVLPVFNFYGSFSNKRYALIYCQPNVYLDWRRPLFWRSIDRSSTGVSSAPSENLRYVGAFELGTPEEGSDVEETAYELDSIAKDQTETDAAKSADAKETDSNGSDGKDSESPVPNADSNGSDGKDSESPVPNADSNGSDGKVSESPAANVNAASPGLEEFPLEYGKPCDVQELTATVCVNAPKFVGEERAYLFMPMASMDSDDSKWRCFVHFSFVVKNGKTDKFYLINDEAFSWKTVDQRSIDKLPETSTYSEDSRFDVAETTTYAGTRAISLTPKQELNGRVDICLLGEFKNDTESVRLPRLQLTASDPREDLSEIRRFAYLPCSYQNTPLSWSTSDMTPTLFSSSVDAESYNNASKSLMEQGEKSELIVNELLPQLVGSGSGLDILGFEKYSRTSASSAALETKRDKVVVTSARHNFYVNSRSEFFGVSSFTIRQTLDSTATLIVPEEYDLLETTVNGSRRMAERVGDNLWRVDLGSTPYVKRVEASFIGRSLAPSKTPGSLRFGKAQTFGVDLIRVADGVCKRCFWTCAFESSNRSASWRVYQRLAREENLAREATEIERGNSKRLPIPFAEANALILRMAIERASSLIEAYDNDLTQLSGSKKDDLPRLQDWWAQTWFDCESQVKQYVESGFGSDALTDRQKEALFIYQGGRILSPFNEDYASNPTRLWNLARYREIVEQKRKLDETYNIEPKSGASLTKSQTPQSLWAFDVGQGTSLLFGASDESVGRVYITKSYKPGYFLISHYSTAAFFLTLTTLILHFLRGRGRSRLVWMFGAGIAVIIWSSVAFGLGCRRTGLVGAFAIAVGPSLWTWVVGSFFKKPEESSSSNDDASDSHSSIEPDLAARRAQFNKLDESENDELESTETYELAPQDSEEPSTRKFDHANERGDFEDAPQESEEPSTQKFDPANPRGDFEDVPQESEELTTQFFDPTDAYDDYETDLGSTETDDSRGDLFD